jgi:hypothetical protein
MTQVSGIEVRFSADTSDLDKGVANATGKLEKFGRIAALGMAGLATAGAAGGAAIFAMTKNAINLADEIGKTAQKIGMTSESLSKLEYAAKLSDVSLGQLQVGLGQLSKNMQAGNEAFAALGVNVTTASGNLRSTEEVLLDVAERFADMPDGAEKTALAMQILGRSGADLIPMLNAGRDGLTEMTEEAVRLGLEISGATSKAAEGFNDNLTRLSSALTGIGNKIAERSAPAMKNLTDRFVKFVDEGQIVDRVAGAIGTAMDKLAEAVQWVSATWEALSIRVNAVIAVLGYFGNLDLAGAMDAWAASSTAVGKVWERNAETLAKMRGEIESVNSGAKVDLPPRRDGNGGGGGGGDGSSEDGSESDITVPGVAPSQEVGMFFVDRLEAIREGLMSERALLEEEYALDMAALESHLTGKDEIDAYYKDLMAQRARQHASDLAAIQQASMSQQLSDIGSGLGSMAAAFQNGGKKMLKVSKAFAAAQAIVATIQAAVDAMKNPLLVDPASKFAAYAAVFAKGMSAVAAIRGVSESGGGGGGGAGGGGGGRGGGMSGGGAPAAAAPTTTFQFTLMNDPMGFGEKFARQFIDQLNSTQRNGGQIRGVIA